MLKLTPATSQGEKAGDLCRLTRIKKSIVNDKIEFQLEVLWFLHMLQPSFEFHNQLLMDVN